MYINILVPDSCNMTQETEENKMSAKIDFLYLSEPDMIKAGVKDMAKCVEVMEDMMVTLKKGDYVMGGENHNSHGCMVQIQLLDYVSLKSTLLWKHHNRCTLDNMC